MFIGQCCPKAYKQRIMIEKARKLSGANHEEFFVTWKAVPTYSLEKPHVVIKKHCVTGVMGGGVVATIKDNAETGKSGKSPVEEGRKHWDGSPKLTGIQSRWEKVTSQVKQYGQSTEIDWREIRWCRWS